ncbi:MAG: HAD family hydrolase [Kiritimatiellae bacterium]|jgi:phosphoglycolate phosphatase|nr:HAD family hydrolase [Kiritimatiellia bacterium]
MQNISHIIWDWNGTLLDDTRACVNSVNKMLSDRGLPQLTIVQYRDLFGFPVADFYNEIGFILENEDWDLMATEFHDMFLADSSVALHSNARSVLKNLQDRGLVQSILSASEQSILDSMLREYKLDSYFHRVMGIDNMYGDSKISMGRAMIEKMDVCRSEILMIGDSLHDFEVAGDLKIGCVLIAQGHQSFERLASAGVPVLHSLSEVLELIG